MIGFKVPNGLFAATTVMTVCNTDFNSYRRVIRRMRRDFQGRVVVLFGGQDPIIGTNANFIEYNA